MRVLVADDHALFREALVSLLEAAGYEVIAQVGNGAAALEAARKLHPELMLLDIDMPVMNGLEVLKQIKIEMPDTQVVMLTVSEQDEHLFEAARSGAQGYVLKDLNADQFFELLDGLSRGEAAMTRQTTARLMRGMAAPANSKPGIALTDREVGLLTLVAQGLSNRAIAQELSVSENTVKYHIKNILQKLNVQNRTEAVTHAIGAGLINPNK